MNPEDQRTSCPGFLDDYGVWNNGFECPPLVDQIRVCCGSESRRHCCTLDSLQQPSSNLLNHHLDKNSYSTIETSLFLTETKSSTFLTLPILLTCILILIIIFLFILLSLFIWYRYRNHRNQRKRQENLMTKTNLLTDHFPFSPPHHQFFLNETTPPYNNRTSHLHQQAKDTLTTTTNAPSTTTSTSSTSGRTPSDIYFNDWKDFLIAGEQPMNIYPTMSSHSNELNHEHQYHHSNYFYHGKRHPHDVIV
jgi:hypothetical protein